MTSQVYRNEFYVSDKDEPHASRRKQILAKYPQIAELFKPDIRVAPVVILIVLSQLVLSYYQKYWSWPLLIFVAWSFGGTASHSLSLMTHECSHNSVFETKILNEYFGIFCNIAMGIPSSTMFKRYHMEHHQYQGDYDRDVDLPTALEAKIFKGTFLKSIWLLLQPLFYSLRPTFVRPKIPMKLDIINIIVIAISDSLIYYFLGYRALFYIVISTLLGMGFHPVAGHFIAEHYVFTPGYETYSYYGPLNYVCWNVGYHNEHHDFPRVPGWRLPEVRAIAPEFYNNLPQCDSWVMVLYRYLTDPTMGPYCRVKRHIKSKDN